MGRGPSSRRRSSSKVYRGSQTSLLLPLQIHLRSPFPPPPLSKPLPLRSLPASPPLLSPPLRPNPHLPRPLSIPSSSPPPLPRLLLLLLPRTLNAPFRSRIPSQLLPLVRNASVLYLDSPSHLPPPLRSRNPLSTTKKTRTKTNSLSLFSGNELPSCGQLEPALSLPPTHLFLLFLHPDSSPPCDRHRRIGSFGSLLTPSTTKNGRGFDARSRRRRGRRGRRKRRRRG